MECLERIAVLGVARGTEADRDRPGAPEDDELCKRVADLLGGDQRAGEIGVRQQCDELVACRTRDEIAVAERFADRARRDRENVVAAVMPVRVVPIAAPRSRSEHVCRSDARTVLGACVQGSGSSARCFDDTRPAASTISIRMIHLMPETFMETSQRVAEIDRRVAAIKQRRGATEPRLTGCMAMILNADVVARAALARMLLDAAPNLPDDRRVSRIPAQLHVSAEHTYTYTTQVRRRSKKHRIDLLWRSDDGRWALAVEAKLNTSFTNDQLEHMLRVPVERLGLCPEAAVGVIALTAKSHALGRLKDPRKRSCGEVRWVQILDALHGIPFEDGTIEERWHQLLTVYTGRALFGSQAVSRPSARTALEHTADDTRVYLSERLGRRVEMTGDRARHAVQGGPRQAALTYRFNVRGRRRLLTIRLHRPKGGRREFSLHLDHDDRAHPSWSCPAELEAFQRVLHHGINVFLEDTGLCRDRLIQASPRDGEDVADRALRA